MDHIPDIRIQPVNRGSVNPDGDYVLYWMIASRRTSFNFGLQRAIETASQLKRPLLIFEPLRAGYLYASDRLHTFVLQGMADNREALRGKPAAYFPYVERRAGEGRGLLAALAGRACAVVTDDFPAFFLPRMLAAAAKQVRVRLEKVDSNGLLPLKAANRDFTAAYHFRRFLQKNLRMHLDHGPDADPFAGAALPEPVNVPAEITRKWPAADEQALTAAPEFLKSLPIDHNIRAVTLKGGSRAAEDALASFISHKLQDYSEQRNHPDDDVTSGLSPYLHFGHMSAHQIFDAVMTAEHWFPEKLSDSASGARSGWWGVGESAEAFLDQLITWREIGYNMSHIRPDYAEFDSLPGWALKTLAEHEQDPRPYLYDLEEFRAAQTHDPLWNAAQRQLVRDGTIHNYLRMLWGKKILEWTPSPRAALDVMLELNDRYALDGRDPNSCSGIFWILGRYDRAWSSRQVFGKVRCMTSENTARKVRVRKYLARYGQ